MHEARRLSVGHSRAHRTIRPSAMKRCQPVQQLSLPAGCDAKQGEKWYGGLVAGSDGALYGAPSHAAGVLRVDARWVAVPGIAASAATRLPEFFRKQAIIREAEADAKAKGGLTVPSSTYATNAATKAASLARHRVPSHGMV